MPQHDRRQSATVAAHLARLAAEDPDRPAVSARSGGGEWTYLSRAQLVARVEEAAAGLSRLPHRRILVAAPNGAEFYVAVLAAWRAGKTPLIVPPEAPEAEVATMLTGVPGPPEDIHRLTPAEVGAALAAGEPGPALSEVPDLPEVPEIPEAPEPDEAWYLPSGGSTGLSRLIPVPGRPGALLSSQQMLLGALGWKPDATQLVMGPLSHAAPFTSSLTGLAAGNHLVVLDRFTVPAVRDAVERFPPTWCQTTPHQMAVIDASDELAERFGARLTGLMHTAAPCPPALKRSWISRLGGQHVFELYGSTQMVGAVVNRGDEWLSRPGTVGRPFMTQVRVTGPDGDVLAPGEVGEVFMRTGATRRLSPDQTTHLRSGTGGFFSVGDLGYLDENGFLFLTDRVDDVIIVGGANVSARETESALRTHPAVHDVLVVGRPHPLLGNLVHALVVPTDPANPPSGAELKQHCSELLTGHKVPATIEFVPELSRSSAGKVQRYKYR